MKIKSFIAVAAMALAFGACQNPDGQTADNFKGGSQADSLMYYFGQMRASEYQREASRDTTLATAEAKRAYVQGVQAGINAAKANDDAYNQGLFLGLQMAMNFQQFQKDYDIQLNKKVFLESLSAAVNADSLGDTREMQREFYRIMGQFNEEKTERDRAAAAANLSQEAKKLNLPKISDDLYGQVTGKTEGEALKDGDNVALEISLTGVKGNRIEAPLPSKAKIGARNLPTPLSDALQTLKNGETGKFATSAQALFGQRCSQLGLEPSDVVIAGIKATAIGADEKLDNARHGMPPTPPTGRPVRPLK